MHLPEFLKGRLRRSIEDVSLRGDSIDDYREFWNTSAETDAENAVGYGVSDIWGSGENEAEMLAPYLTPDAAVLEVGCGIGRIMYHLSPLCRELYGIDISEQMVRKARVNLRERENVQLRVGTGYDLPFLDASFDLVYSCRVFQHIPKNIVLNYLKEVRRVLKPGARFALQIPNILLDEHIEALNHFAQQKFFDHPYPMYFYTPDEIERIGSYVGFDVQVVDDWLLAILTKPA